MATTNNKSVVKGVANKVWNGICWTGKTLVCLGGWIMAVLILIVLLVCFFNPPMFLLWSMVAPKAAAKALYDADLGLYSELVQALNGWMVALYPFCMKKHFMKVQGIDKYSAKLQCRYYRKVNSSRETVKMLSAEAVQILCEEGISTHDGQVILQIIAAGRTLSDKCFDKLVSHGMEKEVLSYISKKTPSAGMVRSLIDRNKIRPLKVVVKNYGLTADLVEYVFATENKEMISAVQDALVVYAHRMSVFGTQRNDGCAEWAAFCKNVKVGQIRPEAQKAMTLWQYDAFHKAGHSLAEGVVEFFLARGEVAMCTNIFRYESNNGCVSEKADALVAANPKLTAAMFKVLSEQGQQKK